MEKITAELAYARADLKKALSTGGDVTSARKRISWLDDRLGKTPGKETKEGTKKTKTNAEFAAVYVKSASML